MSTDTHGCVSKPAALAAALALMLAGGCGNGELMAEDGGPPRSDASTDDGSTDRADGRVPPPDDAGVPGDDADVPPPRPPPDDDDGDGFGDDVDCDDDDAAIHPDAEDVCGDGVDQDCSGADSVCLEGDFEDSRAGDEQALEDLYASAGGDGWSNDTGWSASGMSLDDDIYGVTVETIGGELRVTELDLHDNNLTGNIENSTIGNLQKMRLLSVTFNRLNSQIPAEIGNCASLEYLYLCRADSGAVDKDEFPHERATWGSGDLHPGKRKNSEGNVWTGDIPSTIGNLVSLKWFMLDWTDSEVGATDGIASVPNELFEITTLEGLHIYNNNNIAARPLPPSIGDMANLDQLALGVGKSGRDTGFLVGPVPTELGRLSNLRHLRLGENPELTLDFDAVDLSGLTSIVTFSAGAKIRITGSRVPGYFFDGTMPDMLVFGISWPEGGMGVRGAFPEVDPSMNVKVYQLRNNSITSLPASLWQNTTNIIQPEFSSNRLTTIGTTDLTQQTQFRYFRLSDNELHENWPVLDWDTIGSLKGAELHDNRYVFKHMLYVPDGESRPVLELYRDLAGSTLRYAPQKPFGGDDAVSGSTIDFGDIVTHEDNQYQWYRNGSALSGETASSIDTASHGAGTYRLEVTNPGASALTLESVEIEM